MNVYLFIEAEKVAERSVNKACVMLEVSRAAYYEWRKQQLSQRAQQDEQLAEKVMGIFFGSRRTYGAPRVHRALRRQGLRCSRKRVARIMREQHLRGRCPKRWKQTTIPDPAAETSVINLLGRQFHPLAWP